MNENVSHDTSYSDVASPNVHDEDEEMDEAASMFRLSGWQKFWKMELPFAMPGLVRSDPDFIAAYVMNFVLGVYIAPWPAGL